jgi:hypothetical protein
VVDRVRELWDGNLWPLQLLVLGGLALGAHALVFLVIRLAARRTGRQVYDRLATRCAAPSRLLLPVLAVHIGARGVLASTPTLQVVLGCLLIGTLAWTSMRLTVVMEDLLLARSLGDQPGVAARKLRTQVSVLRRVVNFMIAVVGSTTPSSSCWARSHSSTRCSTSPWRRSSKSSPSPTTSSKLWSATATSSDRSLISSKDTNGATGRRATSWADRAASWTPRPRSGMAKRSRSQPPP